MTETRTDYESFIRNKSQSGTNSGFTPTFLPEFLFDFQRHLVDWAIRKGRAALFEDCGLGKTPQSLVWGENVVRHTNKPVLFVTPLGVTAQTVAEAGKFGIDCERSKTGKYTGKRIVVTNYESLHRFNSDDFVGVIADESQAIKNDDAKRTAEITEFMRRMPYRLLCSATPCPNDYIELGTSSEALGELGSRDMLSMFFKQTTSKDRLGWGRAKYRLKGHAERGFWRWVCSWARAVRRPSDVGFDDRDFILPELTTRQHVVVTRTKKPGHLFDVPAVTLPEQREERRRTMPERCEMAAELVRGTKKPAIVWCHLNPEGDMLEHLIPDCVQVSGADSDDAKEEAFAAFCAGEVRVLVTKPQIGALGLNFQHCAHQTFFPSHSFEQVYQGIRRSWRFGQKNPVTIDFVTSEGESYVLENLQRKNEQAERMTEMLVQLMGNELKVSRREEYTRIMEVPSWVF
jgi:hypothetical protein